MQIKQMYFILLFFSLSFIPNIGISQANNDENQLVINQILDDWHKAAANADLEEYFSVMDENAIYLGTDAAENWTKKEFYNFCKPYFEKGTAWEFHPKSRSIYFDNDMQTAWFDEVLDTWMGDCRGSGILIFKNAQWKIVHYNLAVAVPNVIINEYVKLLIKDSLNNINNY